MNKSMKTPEKESIVHSDFKADVPKELDGEKKHDTCKVYMENSMKTILA